MAGLIQWSACKSGGRAAADGSLGGQGAAGASGGGSVATVANPQLNDICTLSGKLGTVVEGRCPTRTGSWEWDTEMTVYDVSPTQSSLPSCPLTDDRDLAELDTPGWLLRVEKVIGPELAAQSTDHYHTVVIASRIDGATPCAVRLVWKIKQQGVALAVGRVVRLSRRYTIRSVEDDTTVTAVLRDEKRVFLIGFTTGARPAVWDQDLWPELTLAIDAEPVCSDTQHPGVQRLRFSLSDGTNRCTLEGASARCCTFGGESYLALSSDAVRSTTSTADASISAGGSFEHVTVLVARSGMLVPVPPR